MVFWILSKSWPCLLGMLRSDTGKVVKVQYACINCFSLSLLWTHKQARFLNKFVWRMKSGLSTKVKFSKDMGVLRRDSPSLPTFWTNIQHEKLVFCSWWCTIAVAHFKPL